MLQIMVHHEVFSNFVLHHILICDTKTYSKHIYGLLRQSIVLVRLLFPIYVTYG